MTSRDYDKLILSITRETNFKKIIIEFYAEFAFPNQQFEFSPELKNRLVDWAFVGLKVDDVC